MISLAELKELKAKALEEVKIRNIHENNAENHSSSSIYRAHVLVCGGTGCTSSGSTTLQNEFTRLLKENNIENEVKKRLYEHQLIIKCQQKEKQKQFPQKVQKSSICAFPS